jgi:hypothetical protein
MGARSDVMAGHSPLKTGVNASPSGVIAGLDPAIHDDVRQQQLCVRSLIMDARIKSGHDSGEVAARR